MNRIVKSADVRTTTTTSKKEQQQHHHQQQKFSTNNNKDSNNNNDFIKSIQINDWKNLPLVIIFKIFSYLTPSERLIVSSCCTSWRQVIYHSTLWPQKNLKVNLCPHKFVLNNKKNNNNEQNDSGFHTYHLRDSFLYQNYLDDTTFWSLNSNNNNYNYNNYNNYYYQNKKPNRKNFNEQLKSFIQKCSRFLNGITFYFDPNSSHNVLDLIKIIKFLSENEVAIYELNADNNRQNYHANCVNLKHFSIVPVTTLVRCASDQRFMSLYSGLTEAIRFLFSKCNQLEHVSLGNLHELIHSTDTIFSQFFKTGVNLKLKCLHLNSIKGDTYRYIPQRTNLNHLENFENLINLSLDFDILNTNIISILSKLQFLTTLSINVHRYNRKHPGISNEAWDLIVEKLPNLNVTLNLLHTESFNFKIIIDSLLNTSMPLKKFSAYYLEFKDENSPEIMCNMLDVLSRVHQNKLESVILVDNMNNPKNHLKAISPNVLVMLCWRCKNLNNLSVIGYEITDIDLIAMARLRGGRLKGFRFPASCILLSLQFTNILTSLNDLLTNFELASASAQRLFIEAVSKPLKRKWQPIPTNEIPDIIATKFLPQITYHRTIIEQNNRCVH